jgi:hypothetical protein
LWISLPTLDLYVGYSLSYPTDLIPAFREDHPMLRIPKSFSQLQDLNHLIKKYRDISFPHPYLLCPHLPLVSCPTLPTPIVECELRCDMDTWAASLDIVMDPPPQSIFCLRRHRLSSGGGGLWLTLLHDAVLAGEGHLMAIVRRGPGRERGVVMLNGSKVSVDVEELPEVEITSLSKQKRIKPPRIPLDQPPVLGAIRRRHRDWNGETEEPSGDPRSPPSPTKAVEESGRNSTWSARFRGSVDDISCRRWGKPPL